MKIPLPAVIRMYPILSLILGSIVFGLCLFAKAYFHSDDRIPVSLVGVQHLGGDYLIARFYINKSIGDTVGEGGGGGSEVCCLTLPRDWNPTLKADVRWEVHHIIRSTDPAVPARAELTGIYQAQVPVEPYLKAANFYVHFFPEGRVRIVVSPITSDGERHPIRWGDAQATLTATTGKVIKALFSAQELSEMQREAELERKKYGDWR